MRKVRRFAVWHAAILLTGTLLIAPAPAADTPGPGSSPSRGAPAEASPPPTASASKTEPPSAETLDPATVQAVLGREIRSTAGESMGRIVDVIVDRTGQVRGAVIDFGGFLGVGSRKIAVEWSLLRFASGEKSDRVTVDLSRNQVKAAPEYKDGKPIVMLGAPPQAPVPSSQPVPRQN